MDQEDRRYYGRRAEQELVRAREAECPEAEAIHLRLAQSYRQLAAGVQLREIRA